MERTKREWSLLAVALLGIILAAYAVPLHYSTGASGWCDINDTVNCDRVNKSPWSEFLGIPVAFLGLLSYLAVFFIVLKRHRIQAWLSFNQKDVATYVLVLTSVMVVFQLYLSYLELFVIYAVCIICVLSQLCTIALVVLAYLEYRHARGISHV